MRIILILLLLLPLITLSQINQTDSTGKRQGLWKKQFPGGNLIYEGNFKDGKPVGEWKRYHENGQVKALISYNEISDTAYAELFDKQGKKAAEGIYLNQKKEGSWIYFLNGSKVSEEQYLNGLKEGTSKKYYETGELLEESEWKNGMKHGNYQVYFKSGEPWLQCKMKSDKKNGLFIVYHQNNRLQMTGSYIDNLRHGDWKNYDIEGKPIFTLKYDNGKLLNPEVQDSLSGQKLNELERRKGTITDPERFMQDPTEYMRKMKIY